MMINERESKKETVRERARDRDRESKRESERERERERESERERERERRRESEREREKKDNERSGEKIRVYFLPDFLRLYIVVSQFQSVDSHLCIAPDRSGCRAQKRLVHRMCCDEHRRKDEVREHRDRRWTYCSKLLKGLR